MPRPVDRDWGAVIEDRGDAAVFADLAQIVREGFDALDEINGTTQRAKDEVGSAIACLERAEDAEAEAAAQAEVDRRAGS